jgi:WD40 repeat protein
VWNIQEAKLEQTLAGHLKGVWCLKFLTKNLLASGSYDCTIKIWNLLNWTCSRTLFAHTGPIWAMARSENYLISASKDKTVKF